MALDQPLFTILVSIVILILVYGFYLFFAPISIPDVEDKELSKEWLESFTENVAELYRLDDDFKKSVQFIVGASKGMLSEATFNRQVSSKRFNSVADNETHYQNINSGYKNSMELMMGKKVVASMMGYNPTKKYKRKPVEFRKINEGIPMEDAVKIGLVKVALHDDSEYGSGLEPLLDKCKKILSKHGVIKIVDSEVER